jgi:hypothetical protein
MPLGSSRRRREDNIEMDLKEIESKHVSWIHLAQNVDQQCVLVKTITGSIKYGVS